MNSIFNKNVEDTMMRKVNNSVENQKESQLMNQNQQHHFGVSDFKDKILNLNYGDQINKNNLPKKEVIVKSVILSSDGSSINSENVKEGENKSSLNKKTKRKNDSESKNKLTDKLKKKRTHPVNLDEVLESCDNKTKKGKKQKHLQTDSIKIGNTSSIPISNLNQASASNQHSNINISNTNPYIINQNNYFNGFNPSGTPVVPQIEQNSHLPHQRFYYAQPQIYPIDIPHPNNFMSTGNNINYQMTGGTADPQYMWNNFPQMMNKFPIGYYNNPRPLVGDFNKKQFNPPILTAKAPSTQNNLQKNK
jgi:hypothetical protein